MALGRSMIMMLRPLRRRRWSAISYRVIDNRSENLQHCQWGSVNRFSCPHARARGAAPIPTRSDADRPAPAGWVALRLLADVDIKDFFGGICCWQLRRQTLALGIGAADVGFAWSGRRWCRRRSSAASYRVIDNRSENLQHCQWSPRRLTMAIAVSCGSAASHPWISATY